MFSRNCEQRSASPPLTGAKIRWQMIVGLDLPPFHKLRLDPSGKTGVPAVSARAYGLSSFAWRGRLAHTNTATVNPRLS